MTFPQVSFSEPAPLGAGEIRFFDAYQPPLPAEDFHLVLTQQVNLPSPLASASVTRSQAFRVLGPHLGLAPGDLVSVFPPANTTSDYGHVLPHAVLGRRTLPWEIRLFEDAPGTPWVALLLLAPEELLTPPSAQNLTSAQSTTLDALLTPPAGTVGPDLTSAGRFVDPNAPPPAVVVVDVRWEAFQAIAPSAAELPYLAHARQINTDGQEIHSTPQDGWFSLVLANRLPRGSATGVYVAHLVSLEGHAAHLPGSGQAPPKGTQAVRLISLGSWTFTSPPEVADFAYLMQHLDIDNLTLPVPPLAEDPPITPALTLSQVLKQGYAPLDYQTRLGERTVGWYRGPCAAVQVQRNPQPFFAAAEAAMVYDEATGLFDLSFASAWQAGRSLALADRHFATTLLRWLRQGNGLSQLLLDRLDYYNGFTDLAYPDTLAELLAPDLMRRLARTCLAKSVAPQLTAASAPLLGPPRDPSGLLRHQARLPGLLSREAAAELFASGEEPHAALAARLKAPGPAPRREEPV